MHITDWLPLSVATLNHSILNIEWLQGDASPRRYARIYLDQGAGTLIAMDASDELASVENFLRIGALLRQGGVNAPQTLASDLKSGYVLLQDLGNCLLGSIDAGSATGARRYLNALDTLVTIQGIEPDLPHYGVDELSAEMNLFPEWFVGQLLQSTPPQDMLKNTFSLLLDSALEQPQVFVHRDYHADNLMALDDGTIGVLDYQDALSGPITYDLASLLRDCYQDWSPSLRADWMQHYLQAARATGVLDSAVDDEQFTRWLDWIAVQRLLKVLGIFCRLYFRDGKPRYLAHLPLTLSHALNCCSPWPQLAPLHDYLAQLQPLLLQRLQSEGAS